MLLNNFCYISAKREKKSKLLGFSHPATFLFQKISSLTSGRSWCCRTAVGSRVDARSHSAARNVALPFGLGGFGTTCLSCSPQRGEEIRGAWRATWKDWINLFSESLIRDGAVCSKLCIFFRIIFKCTFIVSHKTSMLNLFWCQTRCYLKTICTCSLAWI